MPASLPSASAAAAASSSSSSPHIEIFQKFLRKCLLTRSPVDRFEKYTSQLLLKVPLQPAAICAEILFPSLTSIVDPLHLQYIQRLVEKDIVSLADILTALLRTSPARSAVSTSPAATQDGSATGTANREALETDLFLVLATVLRTRKPKSHDSVWAAVQALSDWMEVVMAVSGVGILDDASGEVPGSGSEGKGRREALAEVVIALGGNEGVGRVLGEGGRKERRLMFQTSLSLFTQYIQVQNQGLATRMEGLFRQNQSPRQGRNGGRNGGDTMMMGLGDGGDGAGGPVVWARGALFVWLNALLVGRPQVDDEAVIGYLYSRYRDDTGTLLADFVTAVLDTLSNAILRHEPASTLFLHRSFLTNKVPIILARLSPSPLTASYVLSQALLRADTSTLTNLPPSSFDPYIHNTSTNPDMLFNGDLPVDLRQELLFACALHGVVGEGDIQGILGELPLGALPMTGKYDLEELVSSCTHDPERVQKLLEEIEGVEGNSGAVVRSIVEIIRGMCEQKETMPLMNVCSFLTRKTSNLDVMLLFVKPEYLLEPLYELLDTWRYEEDQSEYQPIYEEFGYILLLVLTIIHRYDLPLTDLSPSGTSNNDSFIPQLLSKESTSQRIESLGSEDKYAQLGGWIREIFEGEGISDSLMSSCRPQDFYRLVPTLFMQSVLACERGVLELDNIKDGFALLREPFLLPSLVCGLGWLGNYLWEHHDDITTPLQILHWLLIVPSTSTDASEVHRTVVSISARHLERVLRELLRRGTTTAPQQQLVEEIIAAVQPYTSFKRTGAATRDELENWTHHAGGGGLMQSLSTAFQALVNWSLDANILRPATTYTHRLVLAAWKVLGAKIVVQGVIGEVVKSRLHGIAPGYAEDVAVSIILSAGTPDEVGGRMGLLEALKAEEAEESGNENDKAEALRAVLRRVETQLTPWSPVQHHADVDVGAGQGVVEMGDGEVGLGVDLGMGDDAMAGLLGEGDLMAGELLGDVSGMDLN